MGPEALAQVLRPLRALFRPELYPELMVGLEVSDDAAVYRISDEVAVIQTVDFLPPMVDDPYAYGAIAAANAMSDVYAMGGRVALALNVCAFPSALAPEAVGEILRGGAEKVAEAGGVLAGGHTVDSPEPMYGLAVMGLVDPRQVLTKGGARPGDLLFLTKALGTGMVTTALKGDVADPAHVAAAAESMAQLNRTGAQLSREVGAHACTDITGFALLGHGCEMAAKGGVRLRFRVDSLPFLSGALGYAGDWLFPAGTCRNRDCYEGQVSFAPAVREEMRMLLFTPETSGGLLVAVPPEAAGRLAARCAVEGQALWAVGEVTPGQGVQVE